MVRRLPLPPRPAGLADPRGAGRVEVRKWFPGRQFEIFNLVFICFFQQCAICAFTTPAVIALQGSDVAWNDWDTAAACLCALLITGEAVADAQMFDYQTEKYRRIKAGEPAGPYSRGFIESGLWGWSRHPNYFCEVSMWWAFYLFSVAVSPPRPRQTACRYSYCRRRCCSSCCYSCSLLYIC